MAIWYDPAITPEQLTAIGKNNLGELLGMEITEIGEDFLRGRMPVDNRTRQPYGLLHGGASVALAETLGSLGSAFVVDRSKYDCVGLEINANHLRGIREGYVIGTARPVHLGKTTHVWDIRLHDEREKLICISRLTVAVIKRPQ
jgi:1,4-dihydroxy-2-naphthoyl-CoA hydrolase